MIRVPYIPNHSASELRWLPFDEMIALPPRPSTFRSKKEMLDWSHDKNTGHCYFNFAEPSDAGQRLSKDNPVAFLHGFVGDYDAHNITEAETTRAISDCPSAFPVTAVSRTYSGGMRMIWAFERPLPVFNGEVAKGVLKRAIKELKLHKLAPAFDEGAFLDPARYFELGTDWRIL